MDGLQALGLSAPVIQAPMAGVQGVDLAAAVSNSGGLGSLPCAMLSGEALEHALIKLRSLTSKPVNLNFFCHKEKTESAARYAQWLNLLSPFFNEYGIDPATLPGGAQRQPFSQVIADLVEPHQPQVVSFHFGLPAAGLLDRVKRWGAMVLSSATTLDEALWLEQQGADAVIAQGLEAGGHRGHFLRADLKGQLKTAELVERCVKHLSIPVIAAGGIARPDDLVVMKQAGAAGVQLGSAYLLAAEATTGQLHRQVLQSERRAVTAITNLYTGRPARGIVTRLMESLGPMNNSAPAFPLAANAISALRAQAEQRADSSFTPLWCGENACPASDSAQAITQRFMAAW
ncbi:NAD(P)H-dependent flavin oxidoreductase [Litorivivens sp.]|uniref:NAD(P)H-dependent flavin oxidoreductase n=1 Tax=Litorivivens sp. TaxID=2020868 RepID=UPI003568B2C7